jgi:hypothetical protein
MMLPGDAGKARIVMDASMILKTKTDHGEADMQPSQDY